MAEGGEGGREGIDASHSRVPLGREEAGRDAGRYELREGARGR